MSTTSGPFAAGRFTYSGWIPTITGQLSFSLIGHGGSAPGCVTANLEHQLRPSDPPVREIAVAQRRVTRDLPYTGWPVGLLKKDIGAEYLLFGATASAARPSYSQGQVESQTDQIGVLFGQIVVIPHHVDAHDLERSTVVKLRRLIARHGDRAPRGGVRPNSALLTEIDGLLAQASEAGLVVLRAQFELYRTGEFRLRLVSAPEVDAREDCVEEGEVDEPEAEGHVPAGISRSFPTRLAATIASQMYYFAKDISHRHYHHGRSADNLLPLVRTRPYDDESWRRETLWSLARALLEMRRRGRLPAQKSALGVLAYAEAFQGLLARVMREPSSVQFVPTKTIAFYDFNHTRMSLEATIEQKSFDASAWSQILIFLVSTILASIAIWIALVEAQPSYCSVGCPSPPLWLVNGLNYLVRHPSVPFGVLAALAALYLEFCRQSLQVVPPLRWYEGFVGEWTEATGASASRFIRRRHPIWGDRLGAAVAWIGTLATSTTLMAVIGWITRLWPFPLEVVVGWTALLSFLLLAVSLARRLLPRESELDDGAGTAG